MKKNLLLFILMLPFVFLACSDDDDKGGNVKGPLENTTWEHTNTYPINVDGKLVQEKSVTTIAFAKDTYTWVEKLYHDDVEQVEKRYNYNTTTYTYNAPTVTLNFIDEENNKESAQGYINKNEMIIDGDFILTKK